MKEIIRIHIAKVPYNIELDAKKTLEAYLKTLEAYSEDAEIINDIEIRITEILSERNIAKEGTISLSDVKALKEQLGEPREFMNESDVDFDDKKMSSDAKRKLFRNTDSAIVGGVLSGIAAFFSVNALWIRLLFLIIVLVSFGSALLVYVVLWIVVPPAKTAADKLQMAGRPVTISSIREVSENEASARGEKRMGTARGILLIIVGITAVLSAIGSLLITAIVTIAFSVGEHGYITKEGDGAPFFLTAFILAIAAGLLCAVFMILVAFAAFTQKLKRRVWISMAIVATVGIACFGTALGFAQYASLKTNTMIKANTRETVIELPAGSNKATAMAINAAGISVRYIVSSEAPKATIRTIASHEKDTQNVNMSLEGSVLKIDGDKSAPDVCMVFWCDGPYVTIYGPALDKIDGIGDKSTVEYAAQNQSKLILSAARNVDIAVVSGAIERLNIDTSEQSEINGKDATISHVEATIKNKSHLEFATLQTFTITHSQACSTNGMASVELWAVSSGIIVVDGKNSDAKTLRSNCLNIVVEGNED